MTATEVFCGVLESGTGLTYCAALAVYEALGGCVHEHVAGTFVCEHHSKAAQTVFWVCIACEEADGHICRVYYELAPLGARIDA